MACCTGPTGARSSGLDKGVCLSVQEVAGMEIVLVRSKDPRGVLLVLHGCMRRPTDWWHYDPACVTCIGALDYLLLPFSPPLSTCGVCIVLFITWNQARGVPQRLVLGKWSAWDARTSQAVVSDGTVVF